jgi:hypothetical protein
MPSGLSNPEKVRVRQLFAEGKVGREALLKAEAESYHSQGTCTFYGTANSNQMLMEVMGLHLPGAAFPNPGTELRAALTRAATASPARRRPPWFSRGRTAMRPTARASRPGARHEVRGPAQPASTRVPAGAMSSVNWPRPVSSAASSTRWTDWPLPKRSTPFAAVSFIGQLSVG